MNYKPYYVYVLFRETGLPFYVGMGKGGRWLDHERPKSAARIGSRFTPEHRSNMAAAKRRENLSAETLAKRSASLTGQKRSPEARARMSASRRAYLERTAEL